MLIHLHLHYNLVVRLLNDHYGIQVRGGCSCAGTYGHILLEVTQERSRHITDQIEHGNLKDKPGWVRLSLHPTMTDGELDLILDALREIAEHGAEMAKAYDYDPMSNTFYHKSESNQRLDLDQWFEI